MAINTEFVQELRELLERHNATLNTWTHPTTGKTRIYVNDGQKAKVWIEQTDPDPLGCDYEVVTNSRDISEFNTTLGNTIGDRKYALLVSALGLEFNATMQDVQEVASDFSALLKLAN